MYIARVPNRNSPPAYLLRESYREYGKVKNRTLANLSALPIEQIEAIRRVLKGEKLVPIEEAFDIRRSTPHGHAVAVMGTAKKLGLEAKRQSVVSPAQRSDSALRKDRTKQTPAGQPVHSFRTLLADLATLTKNLVRNNGVTFHLLTTPTDLQSRAFRLLDLPV